MGDVFAGHQHYERVAQIQAPRAVLAWVAAADPKELYLSAVKIGEIQAGIEMTREQDITKAQQIER
jgi:predicted nucleic acid-binding protein